MDAAEQISERKWRFLSTNKGAQSDACEPSIDACLCSSQLSPALTKAIEAVFVTVVTIGELLFPPRNNKKIGDLSFETLFLNATGLRRMGRKEKKINHLSNVVNLGHVFLLLPSPPSFFLFLFFF